MAESGPYIYAASAVGAICLFFLMRPGARSVKIVATIAGLATFGYLIQASIAAAAETVGAGAEAFYLVFSTIAIAAAVRMITHHRPVFSALYFVLVVLSSAVLFLLLEAEFLAFALVIVYAGAILITYMFVLMFAQQSPDPNDPHASADYDRIPREPAAAATVGFIMLALLTNTALYGPEELEAPSSEAAAARLWETYSHMPGEQVKAVRAAGDEFAAVTSEDIVAFNDPPRRAQVTIDGQTVTVDLPDERLPTNIEAVGMALVHKFPVSLEVAGVILLLAMFGAVVMARRQIELGEDEKREAAGLRRLSVDDLGSEPSGPGGSGS